MEKINILWADDEIDRLKPHLKFLEAKNYQVTTVTNGHDAIDEIRENNDIDVVFLDESMPGLTGLETLSTIKQEYPNIPVVMITKNEAENVMEEAIGSQISDYLIKPVNPNQILLTLKKIIDKKLLVKDKVNSDYQQEFRNLMMEIQGGLNYEEWVDVYKRLINWELKLDNLGGEQMGEILSMQKEQANNEFSKFITRNYLDWVEDGSGPIMSDTLMRNKIFPHVNKDIPTIFLLLDNLRFDQWETIKPILSEGFKMEEEDYFYSILPTSTQYSRNAIFAGMMPADIEKHYKKYWVYDNEKEGKNNYEKELLDLQIKRTFHEGIKTEYIKVTNVSIAKDLNDNITNYLNNDLTVIVYNFIDFLSHARTEMEVLKELASDEKAYRSITHSWFENSALWSAIKKLEGKEFQLIIGTDHGTIRVGQPSKVVGDRDTTTNLRYKEGRNLQYDSKDVLEIKKPAKAGLPAPNISSKYIFAKENKYFLYPNNYNHYKKHYQDTFQHGGISLEEIICPIIVMKSK